MERVTQTMLENSARHFNMALAAKGSTARVVVEGRNGYTGLDVYDTDGRCLRTLTVGTRREILEYLRAMWAAFDLAAPPHAEDGVGASA